MVENKTWDNTYTFEERTELNFDDMHTKVWVALKKLDDMESQIKELKELMIFHMNGKLILK